MERANDERLKALARQLEAHRKVHGDLPPCAFCGSPRNTSLQYPLLSMKSFIAFVGIIICFGLPVWLVANRPLDYNPLAQVLFSILLAGFSIWFGHAIASSDASKEAARRWLPAAEAAVRQLITISSTVNRMRHIQRLACDSEEAAPSRRVFETQCKENSEKLATIRDLVDNAASTWEIFIANNCEKAQCEDIGRRIDATRKKLLVDSGRELSAKEDQLP